jgi:general secretion pathway protein K
MSRPAVWTKDTGASLVSALLLVAVMASLSMVLAGELRFAMRRSANIEIRDQAYWYALGAREFSESVLVRAMDDPRRALRPDADWLAGPRVFPIEQGQLAGTIRDGNNCFNLNGLAMRNADGELVGDTTQQRRFEHLMTALGITAIQAGRVAAQAVDWMDSDTRPVSAGGEDALYPGYRTANAPMAEPGELLALEAMTPAVYARLAPFVCTRPVTVPLTLNINTLQTEQWPLLAAVFDGELTRSAAEGILIARPRDGFADAGAFWALEAVRELDPDATRRDAVGIETRYFEIGIDVVHAGQRFELETVVEFQGGGQIRRLSQSYGSLS